MHSYKECTRINQGVFLYKHFCFNNEKWFPAKNYFFYSGDRGPISVLKFWKRPFFRNLQRLQLQNAQFQKGKNNCSFWNLPVFIFVISIFEFATLFYKWTDCLAPILWCSIFQNTGIIISSLFLKFEHLRNKGFQTC